MHCFTVILGEAPTRGIHIEMDGRTPTPCIFIGGSKSGTALPIDQKWFEQMVELDRKALELPELRDRSLSLPLVMNADLTEEGENETDAEGHTTTQCKLVCRPGGEKDRRALVRVVAPEGSSSRINYTGCYKKEHFNGTKVERRFPRLEETEGVEVIAHQGGEVLLIMQPNAAFRVTLPKTYRPNLFMYRLTTTGAKVRLIDLTPKKALEAQQAQDAIEII